MARRLVSCAGPLLVAAVVVACGRSESHDHADQPPTKSPVRRPDHSVDIPAIDWSRPIPKTPRGGLAEAGYVGSAACKGCHGKIYKRYMRHSMARSGLRPISSLDQTWLAAMFDAGATTWVRHTRSGFAYRPVRKANRSIAYK